MEPTTVVAASLTAIKTASSLIQGLREMVKESSNKELREKVFEASSAMLVIHEKQQSLIDRVRELEDDNRTLRESAELESKMTYTNGVYQIKGAANRDGTYCQVCWDTTHKWIRLTRHRDEYGARWSCRVCEHDFEDDKGYSDD